MATKHTENYQLNLWEPGDSFLRTEFNENSSKIDAAIKILSDKVGVVVGAYQGDNSSSREINLGFAPAAAIVMPESGEMSSGYSIRYGGIALPGSPCNMKGEKMFELTNTGMIVYRNGSCIGTNDGAFTYHFIAFK